MDGLRRDVYCNIHPNVSNDTNDTDDAVQPMFNDTKMMCSDQPKEGKSWFLTNISNQVLYIHKPYCNLTTILFIFVSGCLEECQHGYPDTSSKSHQYFELPMTEKVVESPKLPWTEEDDERTPMENQENLERVVPPSQYPSLHIRTRKVPKQPYRPILRVTKRSTANFAGTIISLDQTGDLKFSNFQSRRRNEERKKRRNFHYLHHYLSHLLKTKKRSSGARGKARWNGLRILRTF